MIIIMHWNCFYFTQFHSKKLEVFWILLPQVAWTFGSIWAKKTIKIIIIINDINNHAGEQNLSFKKPF